MQIIVDLGGILDKSVNKNTNYLILGNNDYNAVLHGEKSNKHKKQRNSKWKVMILILLMNLLFMILLMKKSLKSDMVPSR